MTDAGVGVEADANVAAVATALRDIAPPAVRVGARRIDRSDERTLADEERQSIPAALPKRRAEFASGRALLHELLGISDPIPIGPDRRPVLPAGVRASLAHDNSIVVAAASTLPQIHAIGVDVERLAVLEPDLYDSILRTDDAPVDAVTAFVLKEAAFKAWSALGGRMLEHHDVRLAVGGSEFSATIEPDGRTLVGRFATVADRVVALVVERSVARESAARR